MRKMRTDAMEFVDLVMVSSYALAGLFSWLVFTCWLHDTKKKELSNSWLGSAVIAFALATMWPISLVMLYFYERAGGEKPTE